MPAYRYVHVDVFTKTPFGGNQLAVFTDARGLSEELMQAMAREMNYSESTFIFPAQSPQADWQVRIFTPGGEVPFAGHPTLGTAYVLAREGMVRLVDGITTLALEMGVGIIAVELQCDGATIRSGMMQQQPPEYGPFFDDAKLVARALGVPLKEITATGLPIEVVWTGLHFLMVPIRSLEAIQSMRPNTALFPRILNDLPARCVYTFCFETVEAAAQVHARMFAPSLNVPEDPATGSASGCLGAYLAKYRLLPQENPARVIAEQGLEIHRPSRIVIEVDRDGQAVRRIRVGGEAVVMGEGTLTLP